MTDARPAGASPGAVAPSAPVPGLSRAVAVLCTTEIVSWGVLFYAFPVLAGSISTAEGWPMVWLVGAFTLALVISGGSGIWVGRRIDRVGPRTVMTGGSTLAVLSVVALGLAPTLASFFAAWVLVGAAMSATLYAPAFAAVTGWSGGDRRRRVRSLTAITLVAGLASTVFAPLTALLLGHLGWRGAYLVLAGVLLVTVPLHAWGLRPRWTSTSSEAHVATPRPDDEHDGPDAVTQFDARSFVLLLVAMAMAGFAVNAVVINLVPLLTTDGLTTGQAATALGVGGVGQVVGRLFYGPVLGRLGPTPRAQLAVGGVVATTGALAVWQSPLVVVCVLTFASGTARGIFTLIQATAVVDRWGVRDIGHRNGILTGAITVVSAFAPWVGALLAALLGSYDATFALLAGCATAAAWFIGRADRPTGTCRGRRREGATATDPTSRGRAASGR